MGYVSFMRGEETFYMRRSLRLKRRKSKPEEWGWGWGWRGGRGDYIAAMSAPFITQSFFFLYLGGKNKEKGESIKKVYKNMILSYDSRPSAVLILYAREDCTILQRTARKNCKRRYRSSYRKSFK
jgi:hypothetical protein